MRAPETLDPRPLGFCGACQSFRPSTGEKVIFCSHRGIAPITANLILLALINRVFSKTGGVKVGGGGIVSDIKWSKSFSKLGLRGSAAS